MANVTIHDLNGNANPSSLDELALFTTSKNTTEKTTLNALKEPLGISDLGESISDLGESVSDLGESVSDLGESVSNLDNSVSTLGGRISTVESDVQQVRGEIPSNLKNGSSTGSLKSINSARDDSSYKIGINAFAEGSQTKASGGSSHAEGYMTNATKNTSHAEGYATQATGNYSHAEGFMTQAGGSSSHAEGSETKASGTSSHSEGKKTQANGENSHAGGHGTIAIGDQETAIGRYNLPSGVIAEFIGDGETDIFNLPADHAEKVQINGVQVSQDTWESYDYQLGFTTPPEEGAKIVAYCVEWGKSYNNPCAFVIGNGTDNNNRSNAFSVDWDGNVQMSGKFYFAPASGTAKEILHEGNFSNYAVPYTKEIGDINFYGVMEIPLNGFITSDSKEIRFFIPWAKACTGTYTMKELSITVRHVGGGYPYARSGSSGGTYTKLGDGAVQIWNDGRTVRTNEVQSITVTPADGAGLRVNITFTQPLVVSSGSNTAITNNTPISISKRSMTITRS